MRSIVGAKSFDTQPKPMRGSRWLPVAVATPTPQKLPMTSA